MNPISSKASKWIDKGKDPRSAHWQAGLEAMLDIFSSHVEPGILTPVAPLKEADFPVFKAALEAMDLTPKLIAVFLPPSLAKSINPPESAQELHRIDKDKPSYKVIIARPGSEPRILCGEISPKSTRPGVEIFQSGALLGTYDFSSHETCLAELSKIIRAHAWEKGTWTRQDIEKYTLNWFERCLDLGKKDLSVDESHSFLHSPTLIKSNRVDALFFLVSTLLEQRLKDPDEPLNQRVLAIRSLKDSTLCRERLEDLVSSGILELLNLVKELEIVKFNEFSNAENQKFKNETSRSVRILVENLI